ncbi:polyamine ABC transporter ATP-binding protein [Bermanella marisrubri]|uniref:Spermidine/putrescine import ATP-binding protein PotA n=1 Tax=Bermanella marisrubri TaxID=207949 RepID=Q1N5N1_9GAMM|nr:polyamine ABC transporter ATP-binding protein [Bermanella marisrubri]EAT13911.1 Spermidine/putrescine ABC transporter ATP-binding subunit [Oceanobacter sp. RED65] [Bermanella marisrubri]QIZ84666.1 polyamine ABC transporter ATP-binding protein [Bermanella marisrubri]
MPTGVDSLQENSELDHNGRTSRSSQEVLLSIKNLTKYYDEALAVDDVSLDIYKGEIFALLGASGSGKSTLLRMLSGFEMPTSGKICLGNNDITGMAPNQRPFNMMFQSYALFPHMSVEKNIAFGLKQDRLPKNEIADRVAEMLKLVHMEKFARRKPHQLSGGQRQRVALARSLAKHPKLLLLDEPMGALDKKLRTEMQLEVVDILERVGVTCVMVTHDQEEAMTMADRIAIMDEGFIQQIGSPVDVYESPTNRMVAEFIGNVNMFESEIIADEEDHMELRSPDLDATIYVGRGVSSRIDEKSMLFAIRPEKTFISKSKPKQDKNWAKGVVDDVAYLGGHTVYYVRVQSGKIIQCFLANTKRRDERPKWDEKVYVYWKDDSGMVMNV